MTDDKQKLVTTIRNRCRVCYTCVRECPAKAIRIADGQAEVIHKRCIGCGNCVRVCSQRAKQMVSTIDEAQATIDSTSSVAAVIAPSFPAEFSEFDHETLVAMTRLLGFDLVCEVGFGADLIAREYTKVSSGECGGRLITTSCPGVTAFVQRYAPSLVDNLMPVVSPMIATARALRRLHGDELKVVFIGPCIAKKGEARAAEVAGDIDAVITFFELREMLLRKGITPATAGRSDFDPPHGMKGGLFPLRRGALQAAGIAEDLVVDEIITCEGHREFVAAIRAFEEGYGNARLLDVLCCEGCIMGQGMSCQDASFTRRSNVSAYVRNCSTQRDATQWQAYMDQLVDLDLSRRFSVDDQRIISPSENEISDILGNMGKYSLEDELNCGACGYETCREHAEAIHKGLAESEMCLPYTIEQMHRTVRELNASHEQLATTQEQLVHSEKLASMGQLAAGIAHEVNNPLGVVLMYAHLMLEQVAKDSQEYRDLQMIVHEADRCKKIVGGLLNFARQNKVTSTRIDLRKLIERASLNMPPPNGIELSIQSATADPFCELDFDQMLQVLNNLMKNAYDAMPGGGALELSIAGDAKQVMISVADTGSGIPAEYINKLYTPFFTTKEAGQGTGLGLPVVYGIVKMHHGQIDVESNTDVSAGPTGARFTIRLPRQRQAQFKPGFTEQPAQEIESLEGE